MDVKNEYKKYVGKKVVGAASGKIYTTSGIGKCDFESACEGGFKLTTGGFIHFYEVDWYETKQLNWETTKVTFEVTVNRNGQIVKIERFCDIPDMEYPDCDRCVLRKCCSQIVRRIKKQR